MTILLVTYLTKPASAQIAYKATPAVLPGKGLKQFDCFYAGEAKSRNMYIVRNGKVTWSYIDTAGKGETDVPTWARHARLTAEGTLLVAHMDLGKVIERNSSGKQLSSLNAPGVWSAVPLKNGNLLVASNLNLVREITRTGSVVWDYPLIVPCKTNGFEPAP